MKIITETKGAEGAFNEKSWKDAQKMPHKHWYVQTEMIESFGILK